MSFDLGVWYRDKRLANKEAGELYVRLCDGDASGVVQNPAIEEFYAELTAKHPEIDKVPNETIDDHDYSPWSCKLDRSSGHLIMCCVGPKATDVYRLVEDLARKHGLALDDPQSEVVTYPDGSTGTPKSSHGALWVLGFFELVFAAIFVYVAQTAPARSPITFYVFAGLCVLMAVACFRQARK
ncbi:MAG TPA: hypothetical protein VIH88_14885 [Candidatus Acidoferrales bacterium]